MRLFRVSNLLIFTCIFLSLGFVTDLDDTYHEVSKNLDIFSKLFREINTYYVDETVPTDLMETGIEAMLKTLDPYTSYINEEEIDDIRFMSTGQYGGIGAVVGRRQGKVVVMEVYKDYPADEAGIRPGDELVQIDGISLKAQKLKTLEVRNLLRGNKGTAIQLAVKHHQNNQYDTLQLRREYIRVKNVPYYGMLNEKVGYISLTGFTQDASHEVEYAIKNLREANPQLGGLVLDMRGNPGGRLDESVKIANIFLKRQSKITETRGRIDGSRRNHYAYREPLAPEIPLSVLLNERSASATEIVAGAIQDLDRGVIIGQKSFGKGLVQNIRPLSHNTRLKVTTARYYTPSGRCIQALDYAQKDDHGKPIRIADSLRKVFYTQNGRKVFDGGGIEPDIKVERNIKTDLFKALKKQGMILGFATQYIKEHPEVIDPATFELKDADYDQFLAYAEKQDFEFDGKANKKLDELLDLVSANSDYDEITYNLAIIGQKLNEQQQSNLITYQEEIKNLIRKEVLKFYFYQEGPILAGLHRDPEIKEAIKVLCDLDRYEQILNPNAP